MKNNPVTAHYDMLISENNDPVRDPEFLRDYMNKWDGEPFIEAMQLTPDKSVLEIGVGTGRIAIKVCGGISKFTGIDLSPKTIDRANENLRDFLNVHLINGDFLAYPFIESFDLIYSSLTFMHIENKQKAIEKVCHLLNPAGRFVLSIDKNRQTEIDYGIRKIKVYPDNPEEISSILEMTGLTLENQIETGFAVIFSAMKEA